MVVVASLQPNELEQKKKRQTLERAKANHLSKQLQMRLQYAKLKVEHGWQRQNLNEVENLYFHHSIRVGQRPHYAVASMAYSGPPLDAVVQSPKQSGTPDQLVRPAPSLSLANNGPESDHTPNTDAQSQACPSLQTPVPAALGSSATTTTTAFDLSDPNILARLVQLQAQSQPSRQPSTILPLSTSTSASTCTSQSVSDPVLISVPAPSTFVPYIQPPQPINQPHPTPGITFPTYALQPFIGVPTPTPHTTINTSQSPVLTTTSPIPTTQAPPIAPTALTYDSFWSTHASSTGPTRALYRTSTGFTASATPAGNVAMLTPGGHAAVMTAEGVYVGGGNSRGG